MLNSWVSRVLAGVCCCGVLAAGGVAAYGTVGGDGGSGPVVIGQSGGKEVPSGAGTRNGDRKVSVPSGRFSGGAAGGAARPDAHRYSLPVKDLHTPDPSTDTEPLPGDYAPGATAGFAPTDPVDVEPSRTETVPPADDLRTAPAP